MDRALNIGLENVNRTIGEKATGLAVTLREAVSSATQSMDGEALRSAELLAKTGSDFASTLSGAVSTATQNMDGEALRSAELLAKTGSDFAQQVQARNDEFTQAIENRSDDIINRISDAQNRLSSQAAAVAHTFSEAGNVIVNKVAEAETVVRSQADTIAQSLSQVEAALGARGDSIRSTLDERTRELNSMLASRSAELSRLIEEKARPVVDQYANIGQEAAERITSAAREGVEILAASNAEIVNRVEQTVGDLNAAVSKASVDFTAADQSLGQTANRFAETASQAADMVSSSSRLLEGKIDRLSNISGQTLSQVAGIVGRFEEHSKMLSQASDLLGAAQSSLVGTLEERQDALRSLAVGLVKRSEEIETTMRNVVSSVEGTLGHAEERAANVAGTLRENLSSSFSEVGKALDETEQRAQSAAANMRNALLSAGQEANRSIETTLADARKYSDELADRVRTGVQSSLADVDNILGSATEKSTAAAANVRETLRQAVEEAVSRFSGATDEIRRSSQDIRKELDTTRAELKRGAFDLPEEAKESAAAMRRAVAEQIKALQDISQLVGRSATQMEISSAARLAPAPQQPVERRVAESAPQPAVAASVIRAQQPQIQQPVLGTPTGLRGSLPLETARQQPAQTTSVAEQAVQRGEGSGWISDLLRGASRDPNAENSAAARQPAMRPTAETVASQAPRSGDNRNPRHMVESLNSLSVDIARAIDHDASVDLWRRYQRGERDVFTRRLYTLKGQQTFDEIKRKYERESEFRTAVDRYIADFEKLLADVAKTDRDRTVTQSYLTSDTGKVYTMLAHAAGRFN